MMYFVLTKFNYCMHINFNILINSYRVSVHRTMQLLAMSCAIIISLSPVVGAV